MGVKAAKPNEEVAGRIRGSLCLSRVARHLSADDAAGRFFSIRIRKKKKKWFEGRRIVQERSSAKERKVEPRFRARSVQKRRERTRRESKAEER